jgi:hypothetical protein
MSAPVYEILAGVAFALFLITLIFILYKAMGKGPYDYLFLIWNGILCFYAGATGLALLFVKSQLDSARVGCTSVVGMNAIGNTVNIKGLPQGQQYQQQQYQPYPTAYPSQPPPYQIYNPTMKTG